MLCQTDQVAMNHNRSRIQLLWVMALVVLPYLGFWLYGLTDLDEGFYGAVVTDMIRRSDWITPTYNGVPWFEKPILSYWLTIPGLSLFPSSEFIARLPAVLCTFLSAAILYRFAKKHFDISSASLAAVIFSSSLLVVALGRMMMTDPALNLCLIIAFTTFYNSLTESTQSQRLYTAAALGFAVLAKGPVALVLFGLVAGLTYWRIPSTRPYFKSFWVFGTLIMLAIISTWYIPSYLANPTSFIQEFLIEQNIGRFRGGDVAHTVPWYLNGIYFPIIAALAMIPWLAPSFAAGWHNTKIGTGNPHNLRKFLWIWALVVIGFFTISKTKLPHYILPAIFPLALLAAEAICHRHPKGRQLQFYLVGATIWAVFVTGLANVATFSYHQKQFAEVQAIGKFLQTQTGEVVVLSLGRNGQDPKIKLSLDQTSHPSLLFYLRRPVIMTSDPNEVPDSGTRYILVRTNSDWKPPTIALKVNPEQYSWPENRNFELYKIEGN